LSRHVDRQHFPTGHRVPRGVERSVLIERRRPARSKRENAWSGKLQRDGNRGTSDSRAFNG
jgi:hypothetical protein